MQVTLCDACGAKIGSRTPDHTVYTKDSSGIRLSPRDFPKLSVVIIVARDQAGEFCETCLRTATLVAMGISEVKAKELLRPAEGEYVARL